MEHTQTTSDLLCRCGKSAVGKAKVETQSSSQNYLNNFNRTVEYSWVYVCEYHFVKAQIAECEVREF